MSGLSGGSGMMTTVIPVAGVAGVAAVLALAALFGRLALARRMRRSKPRPRAWGAIPVARYDGGEPSPPIPGKGPRRRSR